MAMHRSLFFSTMVLSLCTFQAAVANDTDGQVEKRNWFTGDLQVIVADSELRLANKITQGKRVEQDQTFRDACRANPFLDVSATLTLTGSAVSSYAIENAPDGTFSTALGTILDKAQMMPPTRPWGTEPASSADGDPLASQKSVAVRFVCAEKYAIAQKESEKQKDAANRAANLTMADVKVDDEPIGINRAVADVPLVTTGPDGFVTFPDGTMTPCAKIGCFGVTTSVQYPARAAQKGFEGAVRLRLFFDQSGPARASRVEVMEETSTGTGRSSSFARSAIRDVSRWVRADGLGSYPAFDIVLIYRLPDAAAAPNP